MTVYVCIENVLLSSDVILENWLYFCNKIRSPQLYEAFIFKMISDVAPHPRTPMLPFFERDLKIFQTCHAYSIIMGMAIKHKVTQVYCGLSLESKFIATNS